MVASVEGKERQKEGVMTRDEHIEWAKQRALEYIERGEIKEGITSMSSDLTKHPETEKHPGIDLGVMLMVTGKFHQLGEAKRFIEGFR